MDLVSGQITLMVPLPDLEKGAWSYFSWSPDGRRWTAGPYLVDVAPPNRVWDTRLTGAGKPFWSADGIWLAQNESVDGWSELVLYRVDPIVGPVFERSLGQAFPCGWDDEGKLYFVRWPAAKGRYIPLWG